MPHSIEFNATKVFQETWDAAKSKQYKLICQEGSSRSSKTWSDFQVIFNYSYFNQMKTVNVLRDTATDCRDIVETEWVKWITDPMNRLKEFEDGKITGHQLNDYLQKENLKRYFTENKTKHIWTCNYTKSTIRFTGLDDDDKVMGMTQNVCWINEPYNFAHEVYKQLAQRTSDFILLDWNPKKSHWVELEKKKVNTIVLRSTFKDNPFCPQASIDQILSYQPVKSCELVMNETLTEGEANNYDVITNPENYSEELVTELIRCRYNESVNSASDYHWQVFGLGLKAEKPNRIFNWNEITLDEYRAIDTKIYYGCDWGVVDPWGILEAKYYDGGLYLRELNYASENEVRAKLTPTELSQIMGSEEGIVTWMFKKLGISQKSDIVCDNNRNLKIRALAMSGFDYAIPALKGPGSINDGIDTLNAIRVYFTSDSENIKYEQENYSWKVDRYGVILEEPEDCDNHQIDCARYIATHLQAEGIIRKI